ncbi:MAG: hypothetical protein ACRDIV_11470 [Ktedonobacteraceae bacterium]
MNLWAESDNLELASTPAERAQKPGTVRRNAARQAVLPALRSWLLADFVAPYCRSLAATRIFRRCFWLDASGDTRHTPKRSDESQGRDASRPYIFDDFNEAEQLEHPKQTAKKARSQILPPALQAVAALAGELARESKPITLQGIALDNGKRGKVENTFSLPKESGVINASWREVAPALLPAIEQFATIFLLNPLAVAKPSVKDAIPFLIVDEFAPLVQRTAPTELCLLLMHRQVESVFLPALRTPAGAAAFTALLRSDRWKALLAREGESVQSDKAIDLWQAALQPHFLFVQRIAFPVLLGPATVEDAPCSLIFATRRQDSLACMNDAVCGYRRRLEQESRRGILNEGWFAAQQVEREAQALQQLTGDTLREGRARAPRRWPDLRQQLLLERFGQWTLHEYDEVMCRLLQTDEVRCAWRQADLDMPDCRVPGNEDMLQWQWKKRRY